MTIRHKTRHAKHSQSKYRLALVVSEGMRVKLEERTEQMRAQLADGPLVKWTLSDTIRRILDADLQADAK